MYYFLGSPKRNATTLARFFFNASSDAHGWLLYEVLRNNSERILRCTWLKETSDNNEQMTGKFLNISENFSIFSMYVVGCNEFGSTCTNRIFVAVLVHIIFSYKYCILSFSIVFFLYEQGTDDGAKVWQTFARFPSISIGHLTLLNAILSLNILSIDHTSTFTMPKNSMLVLIITLGTERIRCLMFIIFDKNNENGLVCTILTFV
jgi:hypothetical protein